MRPQPISLERLRYLLRYDPATGKFTRAVRTTTRINVGDLAGTTRNRKGYVTFGVDRITVLAHRLAWLYMTGEWPQGQIDHINGNPADNRFENLRVVSNRVNAENKRKAPCTNLTGLLGVSFKPTFKGRKKYQARIMVQGKSRSLGLFIDAESAHAAYVAAKRQLHEGNTL